MVKTLHFYCSGHRFDPWSGNLDSQCLVAGLKKKSFLDLGNTESGSQLAKRDIDKFLKISLLMAGKALPSLEGQRGLRKF